MSPRRTIALALAALALFGLVPTTAAVTPAVDGAAAAAPVDRYIMPIEGARLTQEMAPNTTGNALVDAVPTHLGVDLATHCGDRIVAAHGGTVIAAGRRQPLAHIGYHQPSPAFVERLRAGDGASMAITVVIDDGNGFTSVYAHFADITVRAGDVVEAGDLLGHEGDTGRATGCHLHYGLYRTDGGALMKTNLRRWSPGIRHLVPKRMHEFVDPLPYLTGERTVPLPAPVAGLGAELGLGLRVGTTAADVR